MEDRHLIGVRQLSSKVDRPFLLIEAGFGEQELYRTGHIPGAIYLDTASLEAPPLWNRNPDNDLLYTLPAYGLTVDSDCVVYGRSIQAAARAAAILLYAGVARVRLLNGRLTTWLAAGLPVESGARRPIPADSFGANSVRRPNVFTDLDSFRHLRILPETTVVSVRSQAEYLGETSGYRWIRARGRIAGSVWGYSGTGPNDISDYLNPDGTILPLEKIIRRWNAVGITPERRVVFYCGTGWRASVAYMCARAAGWSNTTIFDGGWAEWSFDPENPVEQGTG